MKYKVFQDEIINKIMEYLPEDMEVMRSERMKNNDVKLCGITFQKKGSNISPTFYMEHLYYRYQQGDSMEEIVKMLLQLYEENKVKEKIDASFFQDFEKVKDRIVCKIVNTKLNRTLLADIPHEQYLDLSIVYYYMWDTEEFDHATILIRNEHLKMWNVEPDVLYSIAKQNTEVLLPAEIIKMEQLLHDMMRIRQEALLPEPIAGTMYVMTNRTRYYGAAAFLYEGVLREFAHGMQKNIYIIPSSVHEVILLPDDGEIDIKWLNEMVREVNASQLERIEILSDHVYYYDHVDDIFVACVDG